VEPDPFRTAPAVAKLIQSWEKAAGISSNPLLELEFLEPTGRVTAIEQSQGYRKKQVIDRG